MVKTCSVFHHASFASEAACGFHEGHLSAAEGKTDTTRRPCSIGRKRVSRQLCCIWTASFRMTAVVKCDVIVCKQLSSKINSVNRFPNS